MLATNEAPRKSTTTNHLLCFVFTRTIIRQVKHARHISSTPPPRISFQEQAAVVIHTIDPSKPPHAQRTAQTTSSSWAQLHCPVSLLARARAQAGASAHTAGPHQRAHSIQHTHTSLHRPASAPGGDGLPRPHTARVARAHASTGTAARARARTHALTICGMLVESARRVFCDSVRSEKLPILRSRKKAFQRSSSLPPSWSFWKSEIESR